MLASCNSREWYEVVGYQLWVLPILDLLRGHNHDAVVLQLAIHARMGEIRGFLSHATRLGPVPAAELRPHQAGTATPCLLQQESCGLEVSGCVADLMFYLDWHSPPPLQPEGLVFFLPYVMYGHFTVMVPSNCDPFNCCWGSSSHKLVRGQ